MLASLRAGWHGGDRGAGRRRLGLCHEQGGDEGLCIPAGDLRPGYPSQDVVRNASLAAATDPAALLTDSIVCFFFLVILSCVRSRLGRATSCGCGVLPPMSWTLANADGMCNACSRMLWAVGGLHGVARGSSRCAGRTIKPVDSLVTAVLRLLLDGHGMIPQQAFPRIAEDPRDPQKVASRTPGNTGWGMPGKKQIPGNTAIP